MVSRRALPAGRNPLVAPEHSPSLEILIERRRLGQTQLNMKIPNVSNIKGAEKGTFDYAHLRVPLPKDLSGSEIFALKNTASYPESYFLMRRSSDGYISATGMFKAAFPWALTKEEEAERAHHKKFHSAGEEEVAGSVWLAPEEALALADEYGMRHWIDALLDPTPIEKGNKDKHTTHIQMPPKFDPSAVPSASFEAPKLRASTRARSTRSASPSKMATPSRKIATPRKPRAKKTAEVVQTEEMEIVETATGAAAGALQDVIENGASEPTIGEAKEQETVRIEVQETVEQDGDIETKTTNVKVDVPADHPELREPEDPAELIKQARAMVEEANKLDGVDATKGAVSKRKAEELGEDEAAARPQRPAKLARTQSTLEQKLAKEKVTRRALVGVAVMTAITTAVSYFANFAA